MSGTCCNHGSHEVGARQGRYRIVLWVALLINFTMFAIESVAGLRAESTSLLADALDFLGDGANYGISLLVLGMSVATRARASMAKAISMAAFGLWVLGLTAWHLTSGSVPSVPTMGIVGASALVANALVALLLFAYRQGDSNMRSVWLCTRNDVLGNLAVLFAAAGVFSTRAGWPDFIVAVAMAMLALTSAAHILRQATLELKSA